MHVAYKVFSLIFFSVVGAIYAVKSSSSHTPKVNVSFLDDRTAALTVATV